MPDQIFDDKSRAQIPVEIMTPGNPPPGKWKKLFQNKSVVFSTIFAVLLIILIGWYFLFSGKKQVSPTSQNVVLLIKGPDQLVSGNEAEYDIVYTNNENGDMINVSMELLYPSGFVFKSSQPLTKSAGGTSYNLPVVKAGGTAHLIVRGKLTGGTNEDKQIKAVMHYSLSNFNSTFALNQTLDTKILPPNLTMDLNGPVDVVNGQDTTFTLNLTNVTNQDFNQLALQLTYPEGFAFTSSNPPATKNGNYWLLPVLSQNSSQSIEITGSFTGETSEAKLVKADLGQIVNNTFAPQLTSSATFIIIPSSLSLSLTSSAKDSVVNLGDQVNYDLKYTNQGTIGLNNVVIVVNLDSAALDMSRLSAQNAIVAGRTLTWKAATLPTLNALAPNESGHVTFTVPITQTLTTNLKNQIVKASAMISADEITKPTRASDVTLKLSSQLSTIVNGSYVAGSMPMAVGKPTTIAVSFLLSNLSNDTSDTKVIASLQLPASDWNNVIVPDSEKNRLSFDPNSGKITWNVGDLAAFSGKFIPVLKVTFQLQITPSESDQGKVMNLISNIQATGTDSFTGQAINAPVINNISVADLGDAKFNTKGANVQ